MSENKIPVDKFMSRKILAQYLGIERWKLDTLIKELFPKKKPRTLLSPSELKKFVKKHVEE